MEFKLTKDSDFLICLLYKEYKRKLKEGVDKSKAKSMGSSKEIHESLIGKWSFENVEETCRELSRVDFLEVFYADGTFYTVDLTDDAIIYMENRFSNGLQGVLDRIEQLKNIIF